MTTLGNRIKQARGGVSQTVFSEQIGITQITLSRYERGDRTPDAEFVGLICKTFGILPSWLLFGEGPMRPADTSQEQTPHGQTVPVAPAAPAVVALCPQCAELKAELEKEREERREVSSENRTLWKENGDLRERCATLAGQLKFISPDVFFKAANTPSSDKLG